MEAVLLTSYEGARALRTEERPVPRPGPGEVLVKVAASPVNPSDLSFLDGNYGIKKSLPVVPGLEGSGTVVSAGGGMMGRYLMGKRVACIASGDGLWADYVVTRSSLALPLDSRVDLERGAMSVVNPLTAVALLAIAAEGGYKASRCGGGRRSCCSPICALKFALATGCKRRERPSSRTKSG
jgi:NADPH2:quinone reductase